LRSRSYGPCYVSAVALVDRPRRQVLWAAKTLYSTNDTRTVVAGGTLLGNTQDLLPGRAPASIEARINGLNRTTAYELSVSVASPRGWSHLSASEIVQTIATVPAPPINLHHIQSWALPVQVGLVWDPPRDNGGSEITRYSIIKREYSGNLTMNATDLSVDGAWTIAALISPHRTTINLTSLHPGTLYLFSVRAENSAGLGSPASPILVRTDPSLPCEPGCEDHGQCHDWNGICICEYGFQGLDCSILAGTAF